MKRTARDFVKGSPEFQSLPQVYQRITATIEKSNNSAEVFGEVVGEDPGLTARLLRIANSAFYGFPSKIETVSRAVTMIGLEELKSLVLATSVVETFGSLPVEFASMESFWRHSLATAICARLISAQLHETDPERLFVAGLLHDLGALAIWTHGDRKARRIAARCQKNGELLQKAERAVLGFDHADVGRELASNWSLPPVLAEAIACHHSPRRAKRFPTEAAVVHVSDVIVNAMEIGSSGEGKVPLFRSETWQSLELPVDILPLLIEQVDEQYDDTAASALGAD